MVASIGSTIADPESEKWDKDQIAAVKVTPMSMFQPKEPEVIFREKSSITPLAFP